MTTPQASTPQPPADRARPTPAPPVLADTACGSAARAGTGGAVRVACGTEITLALVTGPVGEIPFPARLTYTQADPYAVRLHCQTGPSTTVTWVLSRDTLRHGLHRPSGLGDVHVRPDPGPGPHGLSSVLITLGTGGEAALLRGDTAEIQRFLDLAAAVVPPGTEHRHVDLDALISRLRQAP